MSAESRHGMTWTAESRYEVEEYHSTEPYPEAAVSVERTIRRLPSHGQRQGSTGAATERSRPPKEADVVRQRASRPNSCFGGAKTSHMATAMKTVRKAASRINP